MKSKPATTGRSRLATTALTLGLAPIVFAAPAIDGTDDGTEGYATDAVQAQTPAWGNSNFLGNLRTVQDGNNLNVLLAGRADNNAFLLFIDSKPGGINTIANNTITSGGEEGTINNLNGFTFETGFEADYAVRIFGNATGAFVNTYNLGTGVREYAGNSFGANISNTFIADARTVWSNLSGNLGDQVDGVELALDLGALGVPTGTQDVKLFAILINGDSNYASNQMLGSQNGAAAIEGGIVGFNLETETGTQTVTVSVTAANPDNDGDGLLNTVETNGGPDSFVDENDTGTDPNDPDTDDDYLGDKFEVDSYDTLGTNPTLADSDADGVNDATEVSLLGTANDPATPSGGDTEVIGFDFFDYPDGGINGSTGFETRVFDFDNSTGNDAFLGHTGSVAPWSTTFGSQVRCGRLLTDGSNAVRQFNGPATGGSDLGRVENIISSDAKVVYAKIDLSRLAGATFSGLSFVNGGTEVAFAGVRDALNGSDRNFGVEVTGETDPLGSAFTGDIPADRIANTIVARLDTTGTPTIAIWVDPDLTLAEPAPDASGQFITAPGAAVATGIRLGSGGRALWDNLVVSTTWDDLDDVSPTDTEPDGLRDSWEEVFAPGNLALLSSGANNDGDTLLDEDEQARGTNPLDEDTDGDTLLDHVETDTTIFVDSNDTGTDPCDPDTDDDTLADNEEDGSGTFVAGVQPGSNPNLADTDGDLENDGFEFFQGTDPNDDESNSTANDLVRVNGAIDGSDGYGAALAVQTVQTQFGDNASELNAAYARIKDGMLYLMITGNLEDNFNKLSVFIDSSDAVTANDYLSAGNDGTGVMDGMLFDVGFSPEYQLILRRGTFEGNDKFDVDFVDLVTPAFTQYFDILSFGTTGYGSTGTGVNTSPIRAAYDNSNTAGVTGGTGAADQVAAAAVTTGLELCIDLADIGNPTGSFKVMAMITSSDHSFVSNQILAGLPAPQGNLGSDGAGNPLDPPTTEFVSVDFNDFAGDQFFTVVIPTPGSNLAIESVTLVNSGTQLEITVKGLTNGNAYLLTESTDLSGFGAVSTTVTPGTPVAGGVEFTASGPTQTLTVDLPAGSSRFYRVEDAP